MFLQFKARARKAMGKSPVATDYLHSSRVETELRYRAIGSGQVETHKTDLPYIAKQNEAGTWDVKINIVVYDSTMTENLIDQKLKEGVSLEEAVDFLLEKEKEFADKKNAIGKGGDDFGAHCRRRAGKTDERHVTNAAIRLQAAGADLKALQPPRPQKTVTAGGLARMRKAHTP